MPVTYRVLTGPTASGKTSWLVARAYARPLVVLSADSRQVYRHMDIGTGKPSSLELTNTEHYGIDIRDPDEGFSSHGFLALAADTFAALEQTDLEVWVCGGTGLYIRTLLDRLALGNPPRPLLRAALMRLIEARGAAAVAADLKLPVTELHNRVRVLRAAENAAAADELDAARSYAYAGLDPALAEGDVEDSALSPLQQEVLQRWSCSGTYVLDPGTRLGELIDARVVGMFDRGLVDEVAELRRLGYGEVPVVAGGIAYREAGELLDGALSKNEAVVRASTRTRQYAKRQRTYYRGQGWLVVETAELRQLLDVAKLRA